MTITYVLEELGVAGIIASKNKPTFEDWIVCEKNVGRILPKTFKDLVTSTGSCNFGIDIVLRNPLLKGIMSFSSERLIEYKTKMDFLEETCGLRLYPSEGGLIHVGKNSFGIAFLMELGSSDNYKIYIVDGKADKVEIFDGPLHRLIKKIYDGSLSSPLAADLRGGAWPNASDKLIRS